MLKSELPHEAPNAVSKKAAGVHLAARRQRDHLSFKLVLRAKLVPYSISLRLVFAHCGAWANDHCAPSMYGVWHDFYRCSTDAESRGDHFG
jgi:hypothetical protein